MNHCEILIISGTLFTQNCANILKSQKIYINNMFLTRITSNMSHQQPTLVSVLVSFQVSDFHLSVQSSNSSEREVISSKFRLQSHEILEYVVLLAMMYNVNGHIPRL